MRFATGFFGKGQFVPNVFARRVGGYMMLQALEGPYYQPFSPGKKVDMTFDATREQRPKSNVSSLTQSVEVRETKTGFALRIRASGTNDVPLTIEINCREDAKLEGVDAVSPDVYRPQAGAKAVTIRNGAQAIRISPVVHAHSWYDVRGEMAKVPGPTIYLTGFTPFDTTLNFDVS